MREILKAKLQNKHTSFTTLDKYCSDQLIAHPNILELDTLREIAQQLNVSEATISRYFKKIGFNSFLAFKFWKENLENASQYQNTLVEDIIQTINHLSKVDMNVFLNELKTFDHIYISGRSESKFLAQSLERKLMKVGFHTTFISVDDFDTIDRRPYRDEQKIAWILVSLSGESTDFYLEGEWKNVFKKCTLILLSAQKPQAKYFKYFKYIFYGYPLIAFDMAERLIPRNSQVLLSVVINFIIEKLIAENK